LSGNLTQLSTSTLWYSAPTNFLFNFYDIDKKFQGEALI
jgi:hypothetical protein